MGSLFPLFIILAVFIGMMYFLMIRSVRQREKRHDETVEELEKGDTEITVGGM